VEYLLSRQLAAGFEYLEQTGSTNRDLLARAGDLPEFYVLATDFQTAGRGRMDRSWEALPKSSIMASILLRPKFMDSSGIGWLSLLTALAITRAVNSQAVAAKVKWPNDVLIGDKKVSGILAEASEDLSVVVVGFGINVSQSKSELPVDTATSLAIETGKTTDRDQLLADVISNLRGLYGDLNTSNGSAADSGLRSALIEVSATIGQQVSVEFPDGTKAFGKAIDIDESGRLLVQTQAETIAVSAGDVLHLRTA
jgi:BirA family transcriptional regulator, biotin operon repressor / biotin---[acetyl-CoA-carboxylase] ligase